MKIMIAGNHNPHFMNTVELREKAARDLGHEIVFFDDRDFILPGRVRNKIDRLVAWDLNRLNSRLIKAAKKEKPDVFIAVGGYRVLKRAVSKIKDVGIKTVLWTTDAPFYFVNIKDSAPYYDAIFCSGTEAVDILSEISPGKVFWLPFACDPDLHNPVSAQEEDKKKYSKDIVFVGSYYKNRARMLESIADLDVGIWGPGWEKLDSASPLKDKCISGGIGYEEWKKIYSLAKIVLVVHFEDGKTPCNQISPKVFEAMACRAFILSDEQYDVREIFDDGKQLEFFKDVNDLREKILYYLSRPDEAQRIADAGYKEVREKHTYKGRIQKILDKIDTK